jgi:hypothetical protein
MSEDRENLPVAAAAATTETPADSTPEWLRGHVRSGLANKAESMRTGHLIGIDDEGRPLFLAEGETTPIPVGIGADISDGRIVRAVRQKQRALVLRTDDAQPRWLLVGLVRERVASSAREAKPGRLEVTIDGEKVKLEAEHDIELRCGQASLTLRYDGRIELRGTHILSASRGPNRVKGATIALN